MSTILFIATLILNFAGVLFSVIYIWLNAFSKITDVSVRNTSILKITRATMSLSIIFALLSCLLSSNNMIAEAISSTATLYSIISVSWLVVLLACGVAMLYSLVSKAMFKMELLAAVKKIFVIALWGAGISMVLTWLFS